MAAVAMGSLDTKSEVMRMTQESNLQDAGKKLLYILQYRLIRVIGGVEERRRILTERSWAKSARPTLLI